jgi:threonine dehydrogenase-like Zn-dependent dehydrogenase
VHFTCCGVQNARATYSIHLIPGPVGQFAIRSAFLLGAERVLAIDTVAERLALARETGAETIDFMKEDVYDRCQSSARCNPRRF